MQILKNPAVKIGVTALAAFALVSMFQKHVMAIPVVGAYLPS
jgi:hypothetical protein